MTVSIATIQRMVCAEFGLTHIELVSNRRERRIVQPRQIALYLCRELTPLSLPQIGKPFLRDHSTVHHAANRGAALVKSDPVLRARANMIREAVIEVDGPAAFPATLSAVPRRVSFHMGSYEQPVKSGVSRETVPA